MLALVALCRIHFNFLESVSLASCVFSIYEASLDNSSVNALRAEPLEVTTASILDKSTISLPSAGAIWTSSSKDKQSFTVVMLSRMI